MKLEDILTLIKAVSDSNLAEVKIELEDEKEDLTFTASKFKKETPPSINYTSPPASQQRIPVPPLPPIQEEAWPSMFASSPSLEVPDNGEYITSHMVGTFYTAPSEDAEPFVSVGDTVKKGQIIGIIEAMKLMNEIEATCDGVVEKILVENGEMVGFGDELMLIRTK